MIDRGLALSLLGVAAFAALLAVEVKSSPPPPEVERPPSMAPRENAAMPSPRGPDGVADLSGAILARPLFSQTRRPAAAAIANGGPTLPKVRLTGIVIEPNRHLAIFAAPDGKPLVRSEGEMIDEWRLETIAPHEVSLSGPGGTATIVPKFEPMQAGVAGAAFPVPTPGSRARSATPEPPRASPQRPTRQ